MLQAKELFKSYKLPHKQVDVLQGASMAVPRGERVAIIGRSGSGKSTLLHVLGGLDRPDSGEVIVDNTSIYRVSPRRRTQIRAANIGMVFQSYHLLPEMSVLENVILPTMTGVLALPRSRMHQRALELLDQVGLANRATHMPLELSGGEQQRVALARALIHDPGLILADEPTGNLDRETGTQVMRLLFQLSKARQMSLVMVTHSNETAALCDRILELQNGQLTEL